jgi:hypothetical protein
MHRISTFAIGLSYIGRRELETWRARGEVRDIRVIGAVIVGADARPELVEATVRSLTVTGYLRANNAIRNVLRVGGGTA